MSTRSGDSSILRNNKSQSPNRSTNGNGNGNGNRQVGSPVEKAVVKPLAKVKPRPSLFT